MKNKFKIIGIICAAALCLTGCAKTDLRSAYNKMTIGSKKDQISGYQVNIRLYGLYNDTKVSQIVLVQNYMNKAFRVNDSENNLTYYRIDGKNYKYTKTESDDLLNDFSIIEETEYDENGNPVDITSPYEETKDEVKFTNTDIYLTSLLKAKGVNSPVTDTINKISYSKYTYKVSKAVMKRIMADTKLSDLKFVSDTEASVWIDEDGYVYKIEFNLTSGIESKQELTLAVFYAGINQISEITKDDLI